MLNRDRAVTRGTLIPPELNLKRQKWAKYHIGVKVSLVLSRRIERGKKNLNFPVFLCKLLQ